MFVYRSHNQVYDPLINVFFKSIDIHPTISPHCFKIASHFTVSVYVSFPYPPSVFKSGANYRYRNSFCSKDYTSDAAMRLNSSQRDKEKGQCKNYKKKMACKNTNHVFKYPVAQFRTVFLRTCGVYLWKSFDPFGKTSRVDRFGKNIYKLISILIKRKV